MAASTDLERDVERLRDALERYETAAWATLDNLDWVISWFDQNRCPGLAHGLRRNRTAILRRLGHRPTAA